MARPEPKEGMLIRTKECYKREDEAEKYLYHLVHTVDRQYNVLHFYIYKLVGENDYHVRLIDCSHLSSPSSTYSSCGACVIVDPGDEYDEVMKMLSESFSRFVKEE